MTIRSMIAGVLSLVAPGLGQLYNGKPAKAVAFLCLTLGVWLFMALAQWGPPAFRSDFTVIVLGITYLFIWIPAALEAFRGDPEHSTSLISGDRRWYVILMVLTIGAMAVPLIWQNRRFSRTAKWVWATIGVVNTLLALLLAAVVGPMVDQSVTDMRSMLNGLAR